MKSKKAKIITGVLLTPVIAILAYITFLYFYSFSETVIQGSAYGFTIGKSKEEALLRAKELYKDKNVMFGHYDLRNKGKDWKFQKPISNIELKDIFSFNEWKFEFESTMNDYVKLVFKKDAVVKIERLRSIELP